MRINRTKRLTATLVALLGSAAANAQVSPDECFDFSNMDEDVSYTVGDVIDTRLATVTVKPYVVGGHPATADTRRAERANSQIAGGTSPELELKLVALSIEPKVPASLITTRIAQNISTTGAFADSGLGVNRNGRKSETGFASLDGVTLGTQSTGLAVIHADVTPSGGGNWHSGTLEFEAVQGAIEHIRIGGHTWRLDEMCFTP